MVLLAAAPAPERINALAFDNGAVLLQDGGSYGTGVSGWSAWNLTDGDESQGWCSAEHRPTGATFVWDLDTTWSLQALAVSTRNLQEDGYPGITARVVELHLDAGSGFQKVGSYTLARDTRKEFALPEGTTARQAKLVVVANHGHPDFTELAEVELLGTRAGKVAPPRLAGDFGTSYGPMRFAVEGEQVLGCYDHVDGATVEGVVEGRVARVTWSEPAEGAVRRGTATFSVSPDGARLWGVWYEDGKLAGEWNGKRVGRAEGTRCTPRRRGTAEALRREKRVVLYGIRFATGSDVPLPESEGSLADLASALKQDPKLRLRVEGHTDAVAGDAYNLDLSQRRARQVLAALVKRGVEERRLQAQGFGRTRPVADNATAQGRALNRRVEVSVME